MARSRRGGFYTIYHIMDETGVFDENPANASSGTSPTGEQLYKGPVQFPKMLYHPKGETYQRVAPTAVTHPVTGDPMLGRDGMPIERGEQRDLIHQIVYNAEEEAPLLAAGWHALPSHAIAAAQGVAPPMAPLDEVALLKKQLAEAQAQLAAQKPANKSLMA